MYRWKWESAICFVWCWWCWLRVGYVWSSSPASEVHVLVDGRERSIGVWCWIHVVGFCVSGVRVGQSRFVFDDGVVQLCVVRWEPCCCVCLSETLNRWWVERTVCFWAAVDMGRWVWAVVWLSLLEWSRWSWMPRCLLHDRWSCPLLSIALRRLCCWVQTCCDIVAMCCQVLAQLSWWRFGWLRDMLMLNCFLLWVLPFLVLFVWRWVQGRVGECFGEWLSRVVELVVRWRWVVWWWRPWRSDGGRWRHQWVEVLRRAVCWLAWC